MIRMVRLSMKINLQDTFNKELPKDPITANTRRQVSGAAFSSAIPRKPGNPQLLHASEEVADLLGIPKEEINSKSFLNIFTGAETIEGSDPYAMVYGGHQFGNWAGQLGDGRAINLGEVVHEGRRWQCN